jgi:ATP-dependent 26S proteasome regulatory subunit
MGLDRVKNQNDILEEKQRDNPIDFIEATVPNWNFSSIVLDKKIKQQIDEVLLLIEYNDKIYNQWGLSEIDKKQGNSFSINFYGAPGTGKSISAEAIAYKLNRKIIKVNYADIESKYVGDTPKNITKIFEKAKENNAILFFDEADSILGKRLSDIRSATDTSVNLTRSVMLIQLDDFDGIVIFATNFYKNYDKAFIRRIFAHIEFLKPSEEGRKEIWKLYLPAKLPLEDEVTIEKLVNESAGLTASDIKNIVIKSSLRTLVLNQDKVTLNTLFEVISELKKSQENSEKNFIDNDKD